MRSAVTNPVHAAAVFQARATVTGTGTSLVPPNTEFRVDYTVNGEPAAQPLTLTTDGDVVDGPLLHDGDVVAFGDPVTPAIDGVTWSDVTLSAQQITLDAGATAPPLITVTAHAGRATASFTLQNVLTGSAAADVPDDTSFTIRYRVNGTPAATPMHIAADGAIVNGPALKHGDVVTFTELSRPTVADVAFSTVTISPQSVQLDAASPVAVTVTNDAEPQTGSFQISVRTAGNAAPLVPANLTYHVFYLVNGSPQPSPLEVTADGTITEAPAFPVGALIQITEVEPTSTVPGADWNGDSVHPYTFIIESGQTQFVSVTNTYTLNDASFTIHAAVAGSAAGQVPDDTTFTVPYAVNGVEAATPLTLRADGTPVNGPSLKVGDVLTFTETALPHLPGVQWGSASHTITLIQNPPVQITLTNIANVRGATFAIGTIVTGTGAKTVPAGTTFDVSYTVNGVAAAEPLHVTAGSDSVAGPMLSDGDVLTFTEVAPSAIPGITWGTRMLSPASITLHSDVASPPTVVVTNEATAIAAAFQIHATVTGSAAAEIDPDTLFEVPYTVNGVPAADPLTIRADGTVVDSPELHHGDVIEFRTVRPADASGVTWSTPTVTPGSLTLDGTQPPVDVVVAYSADSVPADTTPPSSDHAPAGTTAVSSSHAPADTTVVSSDATTAQVLAVTGEVFPWPIPVGGAAVLMFGILLLVIVRRRKLGKTA